MRIDAHQHFWDIEKFEYPWLKPSNKILYRNYLPEDLAPLLPENFVVGTMAVQATSSKAETEWLLELTHQHNFIKGVVGWVDLMAPDVADHLDQLIERGPLCAIRHQVHDEQDNDWLLRPAVIRGLKAVAERGLAYDLLLRPVHLKVLPELFESVPDMTWVINHIAKPQIREGKHEGWSEGIKKIASLKNAKVYCKVSGMITEADHSNWVIDDIRPYFSEVLEAFTPARLMMGSDWPVCLMAGEYGEVCNLVAELVDSLSETEQEQIWSRNAVEVYRFSLDS